MTSSPQPPPPLPSAAAMDAARRFVDGPVYSPAYVMSHPSHLRALALAFDAFAARGASPVDGEPVFVVFHEGCGDEPGPTCNPCSLSNGGRATVDAVAFSDFESAQRAQQAFWPDGEVKRMRLVSVPPVAGEGGGESASRDGGAS